MNEQQRAELERIRDVLYPATGLEDYDEEIIGRVLKDINALLAQDAQPKQDVPETNFGNMAEPKIGCVNHDCDQCKAVQSAERGEPVAPKPWVGLTDEEREQHRDDWRSNIHDKEFRAIEAKLKEKNT
jgi:hypothetical protein